MSTGCLKSDGYCSGKKFEKRRICNGTINFSIEKIMTKVFHIRQFSTLKEHNIPHWKTATWIKMEKNNEQILQSNITNQLTYILQLNNHLCLIVHCLVVHTLLNCRAKQSEQASKSEFCGISTEVLMNG